MKKIRNIGTTATIFAFVVSGLTGALMFAHIARGGGVKLIHEYMGVVMIAAVVLHIIANWRAFASYFKGAKLAIICAALLGSAAVVALTPKGGAPAIRATYNAVQNMSMAQAVEAFETDTDALVAWLAERGIEPSGGTVREFAEQNGLSVDELISQIVPKMGAGGNGQGNGNGRGMRNGQGRGAGNGQGAN